MYIRPSGMYRSMHRQNQTTINVVGTGTEFASPDIAVLTIEVTTLGNDPTNTEMINSKKVNQILQLLKKLGVQSKDIEAQQQIITPIIDEDGEILEYQATTFLTITFYDLATIGEFYYNIQVDDVNVTQIILTTQNVDEYYYEALDKAVKSAYAKAEIIADNMQGRLVTDPATITETSSIINILDEIIITEVEALEDIELATIVIPASVEASFIVESMN
ncbi:SIMPL domain-containing protein [Vallitalea okinawensis]|uniref:SIMPL domain-containing protein n=1 Tax=Vallitalea okinawensis TaxID=2078660 RepID=UPI000CFBC968|nr:SIMPL domain-containing protein [Vallitalea okinawensis]